jgi:glycosyltransferase involved in cell wall biosynthesis
MKQLVYDVRWIGDHGIGRFAREMYQRLGRSTALAGRIAPYHPADCLYTSLRLRRWDKRTSLFFSPGYNSPLFTSLPFALTVHDLAHIDFAGARTQAKAAYYELVLKPACHKAVCVFTVSEYSRQRIVKWSGISADKVVNVGNGVDSAFTPNGPRFAGSTKYVLCPGNRKAHKNELRALRAFARASRQRQIELHFLGKCSEELRSEASRLGVVDQLRFHKGLSDAELASLYRGAEAVLFPSLYEGFGLPIVEGMACGTPVITSNVASMPDVAGGAALLVDPLDEDAIFHALCSVLEDDEVKAQLAQAGLRNASRFSWETTANTLRQTLAPYLA